jgi:hypothetical protein
MMPVVIFAMLALLQAPMTDSFLCQATGAVGFQIALPDDDQGEVFSTTGLSFLFRPLRDDDPVTMYANPEGVAEGAYGLFRVGDVRPIMSCEPSATTLKCGDASVAAFFTTNTSRFFYTNTVGWMFDIDEAGDMSLIRGACTRL